MKSALVAVLLAFAVPAPAAESACCLEEEVLLESGQKSKSSSVRASSFRQTLRRTATVSLPRPSRREIDPGLPPRELPGWAPRLFSRPPPLA